jgi:hypothetical protein
LRACPEDGFVEGADPERKALASPFDHPSDVTWEGACGISPAEAVADRSIVSRIT